MEMFSLNKKQGLKIKEDVKLMTAMLSLMEELFKPMRFLSDLATIWGELSDEERTDIEASRVYKERDHERLVKDRVQCLWDMTEQIKNSRNREIRLDMQKFLRNWPNEEPDRIKVLQGIIRKNCDL